MPVLLWMLVLLVIAAKILSVNAGTSMVDPSALSACRAYFAPFASALLKWIFCKLICLEQSTLLGYLCLKPVTLTFLGNSTPKLEPLVIDIKHKYRHPQTRNSKNYKQHVFKLSKISAVCLSNVCAVNSDCLSAV